MASGFEAQLRVCWIEKIGFNTKNASDCVIVDGGEMFICSISNKTYELILYQQSSMRLRITYSYDFRTYLTKIIESTFSWKQKQQVTEFEMADKINDQKSNEPQVSLNIGQIRMVDYK